MSSIYGDEQRTNRPKTGSDHGGHGAGPRRFFKTIAGPNSTPYPSDGQDPPVNVYHVCWQQNPKYTPVPGAQVFESSDTSGTGFILNLKPERYLALGTRGLAFLENGQWYTWDDIPDDFVTHRKYDLDGNLLWSKDHGAPVLAMALAPDGTLYTFGENGVINGWDSAGNLVFTRSESAGFAERQIEIDVNNNFYVYTAGIGIRKYDSSWTLQWTASKNGVRFGVDASERVSVLDAQRLKSDGSLDLTYASAWNAKAAAVSPTGTAFYVGEITFGYLYRVSTWTNTGAVLWRNHDFIEILGGVSGDAAHLSGDEFIYAGSFLLNSNSPSVTSATVARINGSGASVWGKLRSGASENAVATADGGALIVTGGSRTSAITHQVRDASDGSLVWERDHGASVVAVAGASDSVFVCGSRIKA